MIKKNNLIDKNQNQLHVLKNIDFLISGRARIFLHKYHEWGANNKILDIMEKPDKKTLVSKFFQLVGKRQEKLQHEIFSSNSTASWTKRFEYQKDQPRETQTK